MVKTVIETYSTPAGEIEVMLPEGNPLLDRHAYPAYEPVVTEVFARYIDENTVFYDIGCRYGVYSILALQLGAKEIYSFDKEDKPTNILHEHVGEELDGVMATEVGDTNTDMYIDKFTLQMNNSPPDVIKIDTEGAEHSILKGGLDTLYEYRPTLFVEIHPWRLKDRDLTPESVVDILQSVGYKIEIAPTQRTEGTGWKRIENYSFNHSDNDNMLLAVYDD